MPRALSKSRYLDGLQCPKLLWNRVHAPETVPAVDGWRRRIFAAGRQIGELAKQLWEDGVEVPPFRTRTEMIRATQKLLPKRIPIFEATFRVDSRFCRVDVLEPADDGKWNVIEVKAGARIRNVNIQDVAFQRDTLLRAGLELNRFFVIHVDSRYVRGEHLHVHELLTRVDVTDRVLRVGPYVEKTINSLLTVLDGDEPDVPIGSHCTDPHDCALIPRCWADLPEDDVTLLHRSGRKAFAFMDEGIFRIRDVPDPRLTANQRIQKNAVVSREIHVDEDSVRQWLGGLRYPFWFLDFETVAPAVPPFPGTHPYQQIPFQYSLHVQEEPGGPVRHHEFLHIDAGDPRPCLLRALLDTLGPAGSVLAWNMDFEKMVLADLAHDNPRRAPMLAAIAERMVDLAHPWRTFAVHDRAQRGSTSLKAVLPTVTELGYDELTIRSGAAATHAYEAIMNAAAPSAEREAVFKELRRYCKLDTLAMVEILRWLQARLG